MVVEHTFVTTMQDREALAAATGLLNSRGFTAVGEQAFSMDGTWNNVELRRGKAKAARSKSILDLPLNVRIEYDRGRISVAAAITPWSRGGREQIPGELRTRSNNNPHPLQQELLLAVVAAIELLLAQRQLPQQCVMRLDQIEFAIFDFTRRMRRRKWIVGISIILGIALLMTLIIWAANQRYSVTRKLRV